MYGVVTATKTEVSEPSTEGLTEISPGAGTQAKRNDYVDPHTGDKLIPSITCRLTITNRQNDPMRIEGVNLRAPKGSVPYEDCYAFTDHNPKTGGHREYRQASLEKGDSLTLNIAFRRLAVHIRNRGISAERYTYVFPLVHLVGIPVSIPGWPFRVNLAYADRINRAHRKHTS